MVKVACSARRRAGGAVAAALLLGLIPFSMARADLVEYSFSGVDGPKRTLAPGANYANPVGEMSFALSAGVDRKVRVSIIKDGATIVSSQTSGLLGGADRITAAGQEYYGAVLTLPAPAQGQYQIRSEILASDDSVVKTQHHPLTIDTAAPTVSGEITWVARVGGGGSIDVFTSSGTGNEIRLDGIADNGSGLDSAVYYTRDSEGVVREFPLEIEQTSGSVYLTMANAASTTIAPYDRSEYTIGFRIKDRAGNIRDVKRLSKIDRTIPSVSVQAYDSQAGTWKSYTPGMTVYENPVKVRWIRKKVDHVGFNGTDYGWHDSSYDAQTSSQLLYNRDVLFPASAGNFRLYTKAGGYYDQQFRNLSFTLGGAAEKAPTITGVRYRMSNGSTTADTLIGEVAYLRFKSDFRGQSIARVLFYVEPRSYAQKVTLVGTGLGSCEVPAKASSCYINVAIAEGEGGYYRDITYDTSKADGSWRARAGRLRIMWDVEAPVIEEVSVDAAAKTLTARIYDQNRINNSLRDEWDTTDLVAQAIGGTTVTLPRTTLTDVDFNRRTAVYDMAALPSGTYTLRMTATDTYGNRTQRSSNATLVDNDRPTVAVRHAAGQAIETISSLDDIVIQLADATDPNPTVTSVELRGGPANETVRVSARPDGVGRFRIEYPIVFPTLAAGEEYVLVAEARDAQGNKGTGSASFSYEPAVMNVPNQLLPAAPYAFTTQDGHQVIETPPLTIDGGSVVSGVYDAYATLRSDASSSFYIGGKLVAPGATVTLDPINFSATGGRIILSAKPAIAGAAGTNGILISTSAPNAPVVVGNLITWSPQVSISRAQDSADQVITHQTIRLQQSEQSRCPVTTDEAVARSGDPLRAPICLLEWTQIPEGLSEVSYSGEYPLTRLEGAYQAAGSQTVAYQLSLFAADGSKRLVFQGQDTVVVRAPFESASFSHSLAEGSVRRAVDTAEARFVQTSSPKCVMTSDAAKARSAAMNGGELTCLIKVTEKPEELELQNQDPPVLRGIISTAGEHSLNWTASLFNASGEELLLQEGVSTFSVVEPDVATTLTMRVEEGGESTALPSETFPQAWSDKTYSVLSQPLQGSVEVTPEGFRYVARSGFVGGDGFGYRVTDSSGMYVDGEALVEVTPFNYPPVVRSMEVIGARMTATRVGLVAEDANTWDAHRFEIASGPNPAGVTAEIVQGDLVIEPINHWYGILELSYRAIDLAGAVSEPATIRVTIAQGDQPPQVQAKQLVIQENETGSLMLSGWDPDSPAPTVFEIVSPPEHAVATLSGARLVVTPERDWSGNTSLRYRAQDDGGLWSDPAVVNIEVEKSLGSKVEDGEASLQVKFRIRGLR